MVLDVTPQRHKTYNKKHVNMFEFSFQMWQGFFKQVNCQICVGGGGQDGPKKAL